MVVGWVTNTERGDSCEQLFAPSQLSSSWAGHHHGVENNDGSLHAPPPGLSCTPGEGLM